MTMTAHTQAFEHKAMVAGIGGLGRDDTLGKEGQGLCGLCGDS